MWGCLEQWLEERPEGQLTSTYTREDETVKRRYREGKQRERKKKRGEMRVEKKGKNKRRNRTEALKKPFKKFYFFFFLQGTIRRKYQRQRRRKECMANCKSECLNVLMQMSLTLQLQKVDPCKTGYMGVTGVKRGWCSRVLASLAPLWTMRTSWSKRHGSQ